MEVEALASLESQGQFCKDLVQKVVNQETFILLAGESGSGRTVVCEQIVNETDSKMRAVFIPCHKDMQLHRLRELFLQQLLPNTEFDPNLNLADSLLKLHIPHNDKVLVVVDDIDLVSSSFYNELLALYEQFLGQERFAFVLVCQPLWAEEKINRYAGKADPLLMQVPALSMKEAMVLSRHMFALNNTLRIYNAISNKLPDALAGAKGNLSQIISITEKIMKEPTAPQVQGAATPASKVKGSVKPKKKSSSVGIFVTVVCIVIVLACLIPIFFGGSFFSSDSKKSETQAQVANEDALVFDQGTQSYQDVNTESLLEDDGVLPQNVPQGVDAHTPERQTEHSVTLSGDQLDKIEGGANNSDYPRGVDRPVTLRRGDNINHRNNLLPESDNTNIVAVQPNSIPKIEVPPVNSVQAQQAQEYAKAQQTQKQQQQLATAPKPVNNQQLDQAAKNKIEADRQLALANEKKQQQDAQAKQPKPVAVAEPKPVAPARPALKAGQVINLGEEQKALTAQRQPKPVHPVQQVQPVRTNGKAVEGSLSELNSIPANRWTVQIVSASNRNNIVAAAQALDGKFWVLQTTRGGKPWYILIAGNYASREEASAAALRIPKSVSQGAKPFAKSFADVK